MSRGRLSRHHHHSHAKVNSAVANSAASKSSVGWGEAAKSTSTVTFMGHWECCPEPCRLSHGNPTAVHGVKPSLSIPWLGTQSKLPADGAGPSGGQWTTGSISRRPRWRIGAVMDLRGPKARLYQELSLKNVSVFYRSKKTFCRLLLIVALHSCMQTAFKHWHLK